MFKSLFGRSLSSYELFSIRTIVGVAFAGLAFSANVHGNIILQTSTGQSSATVSAIDTIPPGASHTIQFNSLGVATTDAVSEGGDTNSTAYSLTDSNFGATFAFNRTGESAYSGVQSYGTIYFAVTDATTRYQIDGNYLFSSPYAGLEIFLSNESVGGSLFADTQTDLGTGDTGETFSIGDSSTSTGYSSGLLVPGSVYGLTYNFYLDSTGGLAISGASATGQLSVNFTDSTVPDPSNICFSCLAFSFALRLGRRRATKRV